jgi:Tol biopolymer transport system component
MTPDGRYVAFVSAANNLVAADTNGIADVFVRDLQAGVTTLASVGAALVSTSSGSESPDITPDGRYVAFSSTATNLVAGVPNAQDIYVRDLVGGTTIWASTGAGAAALSVLNATRVVCCNHAISADGKFVAYEASTLYHS